MKQIEKRNPKNDQLDFICKYSANKFIVSKNFILRKFMNIHENLKLPDHK